MAEVTEKQNSFIDSLLEGRNVPDVYRARLAKLRPDLDRVAASTVIEHLLSMPKKQSQKWIVPDTIPDGRYAVVGSDNTFKFFRVVTRDPETPNAKRYIQKVLGSPGTFRYVKVTEQEWKFAVAKIAEDPGFASQCFGIEVGACGVCGSPLTDPDSIALGIGPICAKKMAWAGFDYNDGD